MASSSALPEDDLTCAVCMDIFTEPVGLKCSHVFCKACLLKCWEENRARECPMCREKTTEDPSGNRVLKNLCESFLKHRINKTASTSESLCDLHGEKLKLFCLSDEEPICSICQTSERHESHKLRPIQEAALMYKEKVEKALKPLKEKLEAFTEEKQKSDQEAQLIKNQAESTVKQIEEEFEKLHQFLQDEKTAKLAALREEEEEKSQRMKERVEEMTEEISSLSDTIRALEQDMKADDFSFLQNYKATKSRAQYKVSDPEKVSGGRIDVATHLGNLKYRVWKKMKRIVKYTPVILDPNTKGENLTLSGDLTSLRYSGETELSSDDDDDEDDDDNDDDDDEDDDEDDDDDDDDDSDDNDDDDSDDEDDDDDDIEDDDDGIKVFGSEGFTGKHCWDVEVGDSSNWALGVAEKASDDGEPKWGEMWGICYSDGEYGVMSRSGIRTNTKLNVWRDVRRVRVRLDWQRDRLSFSDPTSNTSLHTFKHVFTDPLFPWFSVGSDCVALRICPVKVSVKVG
ncbi:E3 ubiquitin-protein ligase TRIM35-like [Conger conger]|uniref:E3 ubiquitin-protein ligase TRIM35-like n=1 Tax=Conger conger TaxID=82655 RepID=UPI002A5A3B1F|nr:E3 ubiquitin-protein ligase TRIM35-like [Conger conger]